MKLAACIPLLQREFPDAAFTADSALSHVAKAAIKGFPTCGGWCTGWANGGATISRSGRRYRRRRRCRSMCRSTLEEMDSSSRTASRRSSPM